MRYQRPRFNPARLALAVALVLGAPGLVHAQPVNSGKVTAISLAVQPLGSALNELSATTGVPIAFSPDVVAGKTAPAIKGNFTLREAIDQLLTGNGLTASQEGGSFVVKDARAVITSEAMMPAISVKAEHETDGTTEGTGSYKAQYTNTATKFNLSPRDTPQTVTVVTRQQMDDFGMISVDDALKATSGVFVYDEGIDGSTYYSRGFLMQSQYDGIPNPVGISNGNRNPTLDNAFLDRLDVLQGASGLMSGSGDPGGTINLIRKRPTKEFQSHAEVQLGSWNARRLVGDVSASLVESGRIRGRLVALTDNRDSFVDYVYNNRRGVYGVIEGDISPTTIVTASMQYQHDKSRNHLGIPFGPNGIDLGLSRSSYFGNARAAQSIKENSIYTMSLIQKLPADWALKASYIHNETDVDIASSSWMAGDLDVLTGNGMTWYQAKSLRRNFKSDSTDVYFSGPISLFKRKHELVFGINGSSMHEDSMNTGNVPTVINVYSFNPNALPEPVLGMPFPVSSKTRQYGAYGVGRFNISDRLKLITGARISSYKNDSVNPYSAVGQKESSVISPYAGLIYDINEQYSAYASYSDIFNPQTSKSAGGRFLKPIVGSNYEIGIKGEVFGGRLNVAAALFRLEQTNRAKLDNSVLYDPTNTCGGFCYSAADKVVSQGAEFSASGEIRPRWNVAAGYTYVNSEYASGDQKGSRFMTTLPQHSLRFATNYKVPNMPWTVGGNVRAYSKIHNTGTNWVSGNAFTLNRAALTLIGLSAKYKISPQSDLNFVVDNLFDKRYYNTVDNPFYTTYGEPRKFLVNLKYRF